MISKFEPKDIVGLMKKHSPAAVMGIATYFEPLLKEKQFDFSKCKAILMGGMPTKETFEKDINEFIAKGNGKFVISKGYSMTEASSCTTCSYNDVNEMGSNGIPLINTIVAVFDPETNKELKYGELGEICIHTPTRMIEYYNQTEETAHILREHDDEKIWIHSGDIGYITENGFVYVVDRIKRMIIRRGFKVFPSEIENVLLKRDGVFSCAIVAVDDNEDGKAPFAFVEHGYMNRLYDEEKKQFVEKIINHIEESDLPSYFMPVGFEILNEPLPMTPAGKVDYRALEKEAERLQDI